MFKSKPLAAASPAPAVPGWLDDVGSRDGDLDDAADAFDDAHQLGRGGGSGNRGGDTDHGDMGGSKKKKGGGFQYMGLSKELLNGVLRQGYKVPTPIQRKAIQPLMDGADVVAMARTGSGKTAAYLIPLLHRLKEHSVIVGIRAVILSPTRELSLQIVRQVKLLGGQLNLRASAVVGGLGLDAQFAELATNPDIVVASPGRLLHLMEETGMTLTRVQVIVLDEADRLFELGLQPQIAAILQKIPENAQRALFSATMPSVLAEFAKAGLTNPIVIRLDSEAKLPEKLTQSAFVVRSAEKYAALLFMLKRLIGVKAAFVSGGGNEKRQAAVAAKGGRGTNRGDDRKRARQSDRKTDREVRTEEAAKQAAATAALFSVEGGADSNSAYSFPQALVFVESKHQADFIDMLLNKQNISSVAVHGHMDQEARRLAVHNFGKKKAAVMVVTDVAARGLDIPLLDYVINFSFPFSAKLFIHRVGRVARAGRSGHAMSLLTMDEFPFYVEIARFFDQPLLCRPPPEGDPSAFVFDPANGCFGRLPEADLQVDCEAVAKSIAEDIELKNQFRVAQNGYEKFARTRRKPEYEDQQAARAFQFDTLPVHPIFGQVLKKEAVERTEAVMALRRFKPKKGESYLETINEGSVLFEIKPKVTMQTIAAAQRKLEIANITSGGVAGGGFASSFVGRGGNASATSSVTASPSAPSAPPRKLTLAEALLEKARIRKEAALNPTASTAALHSGGSVFSNVTAISQPHNDSGSAGAMYRDREFYVDDRQRQIADSAHYSLRDATLDIAPETAQEAAAQRKVFAWSKKKNRFVKMAVNDAKAMLKGIKNEAGKMIDFKNDKNKAYAKWTQKTNLRIQDVGENEDAGVINTARAFRKNAKMEGEHDNGGGAPGDDEDTVDISDPNQGKTLRIGRKLRRLPAGGHVKTFDELLSEKRTKQKEKDKIARRQARKSQKKRSK